MSSMPGDDLPRVGIGDKPLHALMYAGLALLTCRALRCQYPQWSGWAVCCLAVPTTFAYGCLDEVHQAWVSGRQSELGDALADGVGAALGSWGWNKAKLASWQ